MKSTKHILVFAIAISAALMLTACNSTSSAKLHTETKDGLLGTIITISAYSDDEKLYNECFDAVADIDRRMTNNTPDSEITFVNQNSGKAPVTVSPDTFELLSLAQNVSRNSGGAFDVSIGSITSLWKKDGAFARLPNSSEIQEKLPLVSFDGISMSEGNTVFLRNTSMALDLGGIAKGYACDVVLKILKKNKQKSAFIDMGGNIYAYGTKSNGEKWNVGIRYPDIGDNSVACAIKVSNKTVVTSGGYERYFEQNGTTYHHIIDPKTGYPADSDLKSVTIVADSSALADALSTACFVLGGKRGIELLNKYPECEGIFITKDNSLYATGGLDGQIQITDDRIKSVPLP